MFCSLGELTTTLDDWIRLRDEGARPFTRARTPGQTLDRTCRYCSRT
ncbi:MAG: hypothetical protein ACRDRJ_21750 [Streptosporangiaceae bacterium]